MRLSATIRTRTSSSSTPDISRSKRIMRRSAQRSSSLFRPSHHAPRLVQQHTHDGTEPIAPGQTAAHDVLQENKAMKLVSIQVGRPRTVRWKRTTVTTGIYKQPLQAGRVMLRRLNLDGDEQADLTVHGGWDKAVYVYPSEHYPDRKSVV